MSLVFAEHPPVVPPADCVVVKEVRAFIMDKRAEEEAGGGADCHAQSHGHWIVDTPIANPMSGYASYKTSRKAWGIDAIGVVFDVARVEAVRFGHGLVLNVRRRLRQDEGYALRDHHGRATRVTRSRPRTQPWVRP